MKLKIATILLLFFLINENVAATNYQKGDTLFVVAFSGSILRSGPNTTSKKLGKIECKSKVVILNTFNFTNNKDTIEGFAGDWVYVSSEVGEGYVFDAFISSLPFVENLIWYQLLEEDVAASIETLPSLLSEYSLRAFGKEGCSLSYLPISDGENWHSVNIQSLKGGHFLIGHGYWEGEGTELELVNKRKSEVYYLIRHLLLPLETAWKNKDYPILIPQGGDEFENYLKGKKGNNLFRIGTKPGNKIAILFYFYI